MHMLLQVKDVGLVINNIHGGKKNKLKKVPLNSLTENASVHQIPKYKPPGKGSW